MANQKTPASTESKPKTELTEAQLKDVAGGVIVDPRPPYDPIFMNKANPQVQAPTISPNLVAKP